MFSTFATMLEIGEMFWLLHRKNFSRFHYPIHGSFYTSRRGRRHSARSSCSGKNGEAMPQRLRAAECPSERGEQLERIVMPYARRVDRRNGSMNRKSRYRRKCIWASRRSTTSRGIRTLSCAVHDRTCQPNFRLLLLTRAWSYLQCNACEAPVASSIPIAWPHPQLNKASIFRNGFL